MEKPEILQLLNRELTDIRLKIADLDKRLSVAEQRPTEILAEIERIWLSDPENGGHVKHE